LFFFPSESTVLSIIAISVNSERYSLLPETELQIPTRSKRHLKKKKKNGNSFGHRLYLAIHLDEG